MRSTRSSRFDDSGTPADRGLTFGGPNSEDVKPSSEMASRRMASVRRGGTTPELELRRVLHARGLRFRVDRPLLQDKRRRVDIVFGPARVAVFVDGCFWHGCPEHATWPASNEEFWRQKIETNRQRDQDTNFQLEADGWHVVRIWEHEDPTVAADRVEHLVRGRRAAGVGCRTSGRQR